ncbi:MAG TPA: FAD-dependent oxidoreductase, partial [Polyangiaceae bacterium]|nr:FAD-dependent oxidoreductase [Polyangiaceae bacterium]
PGLREAIARGNVGGALEVKGFGLNIHKFGAALLRHLEARGVRVHWNTYAERVALDGVGSVRGVWAGGELLEADHFVVSPGVAGAPLLQGSLSGPQLASMLGVWISLPRPRDMLAPPLKVCRDGFASDESAAGANVIAGHAADGTPLLHISSGHGFLGENVDSVDERQVRALFQAVEETGSALFPESFRAASASGLLEASRSRCIRPWTPTCLGLFETRPTSSGGVFAIAAGHNTGGFAQSPAVAQAVLAALDGRPHPMHRSYHPERLASFIEPPTREALVLEAAS